MTAVYVGELTVGGAVPAAGVAASAGADGIGAAFPDITARLTALQAQIAALATMPPLPSFADMLAQSIALTASLQVAMATPGLPPPPSLATSIAALAALVASLEAMTATLTGRLAVITGFQTLLARAGVHAIAFDGTRAELGAHIAAAIDGPIPGSSTRTRALLLATTSGTTWSVMSQVFKVTP